MENAYTLYPFSNRYTGQLRVKLLTLNMIISSGLLCIGICGNFMLQHCAHAFVSSSSVVSRRKVTWSRRRRPEPAIASERTYSLVTRHAYYLTSALESVANVTDDSEVITWIDPADTTHPPVGDSTRSVDNSSTASASLMTMPLYPLSATYLPYTNVNHTLRNTEPRNIRMALDLVVPKDDSDDDEEEGVDDDWGAHDGANNDLDPLFCVALRAVDSGRIATVGTVMRILETEPQYDNGEVKRVIVTCQAIDRVDILTIENPNAANTENRLLRSAEYLRAKVAPRRDDDDDDPIPKIGKVHYRHKEANNPTSVRLIENYQEVRKFYLAGIGDKDLPSFSLATLPDALPILTTQDCGVATLWRVAQVWQTLCNTVREGRQICLAADRNELLVAAAIRKGGALKLPVTLGDVGLEDRKQIQEMETRVQREWVEMDLEPCIDFQIFSTLRSYEERLRHLADMIFRERLRLEHIALYNTQMDDVEDEPEPPKKGAWFEDDW